MRALAVLLPSIALVLFSCSSSRREIPESRLTVDTVPLPSPLSPGAGSLQISPGHCRVVATVLALDSAGGGGVESLRTALVRIDSVLGYGPAFLNPLAAGQSVTVRFDPSPVEVSVPPREQGWTGLKPGERFRADLEEPGETLIGAGARSSYRVNAFQRMSTH